MAHSTASYSHELIKLQTCTNSWVSINPFTLLLPSSFLGSCSKPFSPDCWKLLSDLCSNVAIGQFRLIFFIFVFHLIEVIFPSLAFTSLGSILQAVSYSISASGLLNQAGTVLSVSTCMTGCGK